MSKLYSRNFYPNPFRYRKLDNTLDQLEIFDSVKKNIRPFLTKGFQSIENYIDELGNFKSETKVIRILREKLRNTSEKISYSINNFEKYNSNLRYLELPLQPITDKNGFEVQFLSNELLDDVIEEIDEGFSYIYDYCSQAFPESIELWTDYAALTPNEFPFINHDSLLESTYEIFDKIFDNLQKNSLNLFNWVISGDLNKQLLTVIKPQLKQTKVNHLLTLLESLLTLTLCILILKYLLKKSKRIFSFNNKRLTISNIHDIFFEIKKDLNFKKFRMKQRNKKIKAKILRFKYKCKYQIAKLLT